MAKRNAVAKKAAKALSKPARSKPAKTKAAKTKNAAKKSSSKVVNLSADKTAVKLPRATSKPFGQAGRALDGVRILDFTHVQSGPTCTQLLAYMGADVIKVERPGTGDITRGQLRDVKGADSLYFTMLNGSKRSITIDSKHAKGKEILDRLVKQCDVLVENFAPGALDRMGLTWEHIHKLNPRMIVASVKGFGPGPYEDCKVYENVAQCAGGSASTTGFRDGPPLVTGAQIGDSGTGLHLALGIVTALFQRIRTGRGQRVLAAMQDGVLNLCRVKLRDQQRLRHGALTEYSQFGEGVPFGRAVPRAGNDSGGGQPGWILKCKGWETDPDAYIYFIGLCHAAGAAAALAENFRHSRAVDGNQDQIRGHGNPQQIRYSLRPHPVDERDRRRALAARDGHCCGGRPSHPRQVFDRRQSRQAVGLACRRAPLAAAWRAYGGNPAARSRLFGQGDRRDQCLRRDHRARQAGQG
jgi:formyl-CoA transferase